MKRPPEADDLNDAKRESRWTCTRSGYDFCDGPCKRCDERAADMADDRRDTLRDERAS